MEEKRLKELVIKMKSGDLSYFDEFYNSVKDKVFYNILAITKDYELSEDLLQDTFVKFLKNLSKVNENNSILGFLMVISKNTTTDYFKKANRVREYDDVRDDPVCATKDSYNVDQNILLNKIEKILNDKEFEVFTMHVLSEMTFSEISKELHKPLGTVQWRYNNAIKKLQKELDYE